MKLSREEASKSRRSGADREAEVKDFRLLPAGEAAVVVELGNAIDPALNARVRALDAALAREPFPGLLETIPTYRSLLVFFDPLVSDASERSRHLSRLASATSVHERQSSAIREVPVVYDGEDLDDVAHRHGISREDVVSLHTGSEVTAFMLGFVPGFAYMGLVPEAIATPRRETPRTRVPAGSVGIAGRQTGIYPASTPGGWNLIGRSAVRLFDPDRDPPSFFQPGDRVRFVSVPDAEPYVPWTPSPSTASKKGEPALEVLDGGLLTTVQDLGRTGYQRFGVPVAGAVDAPSLRAANDLVSNPVGDAALECTVTGPVLRVLRPLLLAVTGADLEPVLERADLGRWKVPMWTSFFARPGNVLSFAGRLSGCRAYVAVSGGVAVPEVLGSRATFMMSGLGGFMGRRLQAGDVLRGYAIERAAAGASLAEARKAEAGRRWPERWRPSMTGEAILRVVLGPQADYFTEDAIEDFLQSSFVLAPTSDRMGCRLEGPPIRHKGEKEIVSDGMFAGAVQVPPDGKPIVMLSDRATTGGYPKIATIIGCDLPKVGQLVPGDTLRFTSMDVEEARAAALEALRVP